MPLVKVCDFSTKLLFERSKRGRSKQRFAKQHDRTPLGERAGLRLHALASPASFCDGGGDGKPGESAPLYPSEKNLFRRSTLQHLQKVGRCEFAGNGGVENNSAADGDHWRKLANDEAVAGQGQQQP